MRIFVNFFLIAISFLGTALKVEAKDKTLCSKIEIEEDTGATIYNSSQICGGLR